MASLSIANRYLMMQSLDVSETSSQTSGWMLLITFCISYFNSEILWGFFSFTFDPTKLHKKNGVLSHDLGGRSLVVGW